MRFYGILFCCFSASAAEIYKSTDLTILINADKIPLNELFALHAFTEVPADCVLCDAQMKQHGHGMTVKPQCRKTSKKTFEISGLKLHMPGKWSFSCQVLQQKKVIQKFNFDYFI